MHVGIRIFVAAMLSFPAVLCDEENVTVPDTVDLRNGQGQLDPLDEYSLSANGTRQVVNETYQKVPLPRENPYLAMERQGILTELEKKIAFLKQENEKLSETKGKLLGTCDAKLKQLTEVYNSIVESLNLDMPEINQWERRLQYSMLTYELLVKTLKEVLEFIGLLELKKSVLVEDLGLLEAREKRYPSCQNYKKLFTIQPGIPVITAEDPHGPEDQEGPDEHGGPIRTRAFSDFEIGVRTLSIADIGKTLFERKRALLEVKLEQEVHINRELKNGIRFYAGYCGRSSGSLKKRIELLRSYPTGHHSLEDLKGQVQVLETEIAKKKGQLSSVKNTLLQLAEEVLKLQERYNSLREMTDCFLELARFRIDAALATMSQKIVSVEQRGTYNEEEIVQNEAEVLEPLPEQQLPGFPHGPPQGGVRLRSESPSSPSSDSPNSPSSSSTGSLSSPSSISPSSPSSDSTSSPSSVEASSLKIEAAAAAGLDQENTVSSAEKEVTPTFRRYLPTK